MSYQSWITQQEEPQLFERTGSIMRSFSKPKERWQEKIEVIAMTEDIEELARLRALGIEKLLKQKRNEKDI